jgi:hypothetical protein
MRIVKKLTPNIDSHTSYHHSSEANHAFELLYIYQAPKSFNRVFGWSFCDAESHSSLKTATFGKVPALAPSKLAMSFGASSSPQQFLSVSISRYTNTDVLRRCVIVKKSGLLLNEMFQIITNQTSFSILYSHVLVSFIHALSCCP